MWKWCGPKTDWFGLLELDPQTDWFGLPNRCGNGVAHKQTGLACPTDVEMVWPQNRLVWLAQQMWKWCGPKTDWFGLLMLWPTNRLVWLAQQMWKWCGPQTDWFGLPNRCGNGVAHKQTGLTCWCWGPTDVEMWPINRLVWLADAGAQHVEMVWPTDWFGLPNRCGNAVAHKQTGLTCWCWGPADVEMLWPTNRLVWLARAGAQQMWKCCGTSQGNLADLQLQGQIFNTFRGNYSVMRYWCNSILKRLMIPLVLMADGSEFQQAEPKKARLVL